MRPRHVGGYNAVWDCIAESLFRSPVASGARGSVVVMPAFRSPDTNQVLCHKGGPNSGIPPDRIR